MFDRRQKINLACALVCAGMLGYAIFYAERVLGYQPCPLCMFQRVCIGALGLIFLIAGLHRARYRGAIVYSVFIFIAAAAATWVAGRHVWIQHQQYSSSKRVKSQRENWVAPLGRCFGTAFRPKAGACRFISMR